MLLAIILSFGAVDALIPLLIILILIGAAAGLMRGWDAFGKLFGISVLAGIGSGAAAKGALKGQSGFGAGGALAGAGIAGGGAAGNAAAGALQNIAARNAAFAAQIAGMGAGAAAGGAGAAAGVGIAAAAAVGAGGAAGGGILGASRAGIARLPGKDNKFVKMAVKGVKVAGKAGSILIAPKGTKPHEMAEKGAERAKKAAGNVAGTVSALAGRRVGTPLSGSIQAEIGGLRAGFGSRTPAAMQAELARAKEEYASAPKDKRVALRKEMADLNGEISQRRILGARLMMLKEQQRIIDDAKKKYLQTHDEKEFRKAFNKVWKSTQGREPGGAGLVWSMTKAAPGIVGNARNKNARGARVKNLKKQILDKYARGARWTPPSQPRATYSPPAAVNTLSERNRKIAAMRMRLTGKIRSAASKAMAPAKRKVAAKIQSKPTLNALVQDSIAYAKYWKASGGYAGKGGWVERQAEAHQELHENVQEKLRELIKQKGYKQGVSKVYRKVGEAAKLPLGTLERAKAAKEEAKRKRGGKKP